MFREQRQLSQHPLRGEHGAQHQLGGERCRPGRRETIGLSYPVARWEAS
jgi:hypothetical protein